MSDKNLTTHLFPSLSTEDVQRVLEFFHIDKQWFEHLLDRDFNCKCNVSDRDEWDYCREWDLMWKVNVSKKNYEQNVADLSEYLEALSEK
jgi:hypothetical protein